MQVAGKPQVLQAKQETPEDYSSDVSGLVLEHVSNNMSRGMIIHDRTPLTVVSLLL